MIREAAYYFPNFFHSGAETRFSHSLGRTLPLDLGSANGWNRRVSLVIERLGAGRLLRRTADVARGDGNRHSCPTAAVPARLTEGGARDKFTSLG